MSVRCEWAQVCGSKLLKSACLLACVCLCVILASYESKRFRHVMRLGMVEQVGKVPAVCLLISRQQRGHNIIGWGYQKHQKGWGQTVSLLCMLWWTVCVVATFNGVSSREKRIQCRSRPEVKNTSTHPTVHHPIPVSYSVAIACHRLTSLHILQYNVTLSSLECISWKFTSVRTRFRNLCWQGLTSSKPNAACGCRIDEGFWYKSAQDKIHILTWRMFDDMNPPDRALPEKRYLHHWFKSKASDAIMCLICKMKVNQDH